MGQIKNDILLRKIALLLKQLRNEKAITLEGFYLDTGIHLARIEQGKNNVSISTLARVCDYFEISLADFFRLLEDEFSK